MAHLSSILVKPASADCNLHCTYCFYHERPTDPYQTVRGRHLMDDATLRDLIREGMRLMPEVATFGWQGGEPTLAGVEFFHRVVHYQQKFGRSGQYVSNGLQTNGTLIDDRWAELFARYAFLIGVSLDGPQTWHDHYRRTVGGIGSYEKVMRSINILRRHHVEFNILAVVNDVTAKHPREIWEFMREQGFNYLQFIPIVELDPQTGKLTDFAVSPQQFGDFMCTVFDLWYNDGHPEVSVRLFDNLLLAYAGHGPQVCQFQPECGDYVVVEYNGDVYPCDFYVEQRWYLGNLRKRPLDKIVADKKAVAFRRRKRHGDPDCDTCRWLDICNHGCPLMRDHNPHGHTHYLCPAYKQIFAHSEPRLRELSKLVPPPTTAATSRRADTPPRRRGASRQARRPRRNDPCPCGSGKKYKNCCGSKR